MKNVEITKETSLIFNSPIGRIKITESNDFVVGVELTDAPISLKNEHEVLLTCKSQLQQFFAGERKSFELPIKITGTAFQKKVFEELCQIPYGKTASYAAIARKICAPGAYRAVGMANNRNKHLIVVPCHRVIGSDGSLVGYAAGLPKKKFLLDLEKSLLVQEGG